MTAISSLSAACWGGGDDSFHGGQLARYGAATSRHGRIKRLGLHGDHGTRLPVSVRIGLGGRLVDRHFGWQVEAKRPTPSLGSSGIDIFVFYPLDGNHRQWPLLHALYSLDRAAMHSAIKTDVGHGQHEVVNFRNHHRTPGFVGISK